MVGLKLVGSRRWLKQKGCSAELRSTQKKKKKGSNLFIWIASLFELGHIYMWKHATSMQGGSVDYCTKIHIWCIPGKKWQLQAILILVYIIFVLITMPTEENIWRTLINKPFASKH